MFFDLFNKPVLPKSLQLRIPYMGSKRKIAEQLMQKMLEIKPKAKYFYDLFAGGGAMSFYALQCGLKVHYNEKQKGMVDLLEYILNRARNKEKGQYGLFPDDFYNFITREEFFKLKDENSIKGQFARIIYSFGNNQTAYLFGKDIEYQKQLGHNIVMFCCEKSLKELNLLLNTNIKIRNAKTWNERRLDYKKQRLQQLERLEKLINLQKLERLEQLEKLPAFTISNLDFTDVKITTPLDETIIYLDPPYRGTAEYKEKFNYEKADEFFKNSSYTCFMSEYNAPFNSILEIRKESLLNNKNSLKEKKFIIEKLFYNGK